MRLGLETLDERAWGETVDASPAASFFHHPAWAAVARAQYAQGEALALGGELGDGAQLVVPLFRPAGDVLGGAVLSTFAGCYGAAVATRELLPAEQDAALIVLARQRFGGPLLLTLSPEASAQQLDRGLAALRGLYRPQEDFTHQVELRDRDPREILAALQQAKRRQYRKGVALGAQLREGQGADLETYLGIYAQATRRRGAKASSRYPAPVYERLAALISEQRSSVRLWLLELAGEAVAGAWVFEAGGRAVLWDAAALDVGSAQFSPVASLYVELLLEGVARGLSSFDLGPSGGHASAEELKRRLGAQRRPVLRLRRDPPRWLRLRLRYTKDEGVA